MAFVWHLLVLLSSTHNRSNCFMTSDLKVERSRRWSRLLSPFSPSLLSSPIQSSFSILAAPLLLRCTRILWNYIHRSIVYSRLIWLQKAFVLENSATSYLLGEWSRRIELRRRQEDKGPGGAIHDGAFVVVDNISK